jgi:phosphoglucosamine mutase
MSERLFGTDGVRGRAGTWPLVPEFVERLGYFAGREFLGKGSRTGALILRDTRGSGPALQAALARGMGRSGLAVVDGGVLPTAAAAILIPREGFSGGAVISASHNPAEFNGIKLFDSRGRKLDEKTEDRIEAGARGTDPLPARSAAHSTRAERASSSDLRARARRDYLDFIRKTAPGLNLKGLTVAVDAGNGAASSVAPELFRSLGATVVVRFNSPDGRNINRD